MKRKKLRRWSHSEEEFLRKNYNKLSDQEMGEKLNRTTAAVREKRYALDLKRRGLKRWTESEVKKLEKYLEKDMSVNDISKKLGKDPATVRYKISYIFDKQKGTVESDPAKSYLTPEQKEMVRMALINRLDRCDLKDASCTCHHCREGQQITAIYDIRDKKKAQKYFNEIQRLLKG